MPLIIPFASNERAESKKKPRRSAVFRQWVADYLCVFFVSEALYKLPMKLFTAVV